ncbi:MAG: phenylalanine--tRNA ligase subunit beta [Candidatus Omnitrophica bacterium]|nr:phenylalanine--tRNA ligase subunit beta [Candidatus Omnitrophota bacterium]
MKVTYNWLKEFLNIKISPKELAEKLTMAGLEVVSLEEAGRDFVFEIEITSNRPDWLSILGVAREIGAVTGEKLKAAVFKEPKIKAKEINPVKISILDKKDCSFYSARLICGVKVGPSPLWLKERLELLGCRSVNNIVDITNYILFELGHPLHAFDLDLLAGKEIVVRRAKAGEKMVTLDNQPRLLGNDILIIADKDRPQAIAGIMGGKDTEVTFKTRNILLESAVFNPVLVRRARQRLGLQSESAYRFERGVNLETAKAASLAAQELICNLASGKPCGYKCPSSPKISGAMINLEPAYVNRMLGTDIPALKIKKILSGLGFDLKMQSKNRLVVGVPGFRQDVKLPIDLAEEVARIYGYSEIAQTLPAIKPNVNIGGKRDIVPQIKNVLVGLGLHEAITYSLVDRDLLKKSGIKPDAQSVEILNPLSKEQEVLRPTLLPSLIRCLAYNLDQQQEYVNIFEIANVFSYGKGASGNPVSQGAIRPGSVDESLSLSIALCGMHSFLTRQGLIRDEVTILHLKGILEGLFNKLGIRDYDFRAQGERGVSIIVNQQEIGIMLNLNKKVLDAFDIKNKQVILAEINLGKISAFVNIDNKFSGLPKYPAITRDISFVVKGDISIKDLLTVITGKGLPLLRSAEVVDYYQGKQIPEGCKGLTVSCVYRADDRTLTEEEISLLHNSICSLLEERFSIKLR